MRTVPLALKLYALSLMLAAGTLGWLTTSGHLRAAPLMESSNQVATAALATLLTALIVVSGLFPIQIARQTKVSVNTAGQFAAVLLFGAPLGPIIAAIGLASNNAILWTRGKRTLFDVVLNATEAFTTVTLSALAAHFVGTSVPPPLDVPLAATSAAAVMYVTNIALVQGAVATHHKVSPVALVWTTVQGIFWQHAALFLLGYLAALSAPQHPSAPLLVALPTIIVYFSFRANHRLRTQTREAVEAMADLVDMRDPYTAGHCQRVAHLSARLAQRLSLPPDQVELIRSAARVHDIGKIGVADEVLHKAGPLVEAEWQQMRAHPQAGASLLARFPDYTAGRELVHDHHERFDGRGYPRSLQAARLPIGARIIAVADSYDAMTTDRPYRSALTPRAVIEELRRHRGGQWDPQVVDALLEVVEEQHEVSHFQRAPLLASTAAGA